MNRERSPEGVAMVRTVRVGGMSKTDLLNALEDKGIQLNAAGRTLFAHSGFTTHPVISDIEIVELCIADLGYPDGATTAEVHRRIAELDLLLCPLELGPHLRLQFLEQPEGSLGHPPSEHRAPPGSITVATRQLTEDDETPKGFYLRRIEGILWLRGYRSWSGHLWSPEDRFVFCRPQSAALGRHRMG
jgi:hypothetical protein